MKNVLAIHDISCVGRCSLTVALPIISGFGSCCNLLPTALLSTHTGGFTGFTYMDLTDEMHRIIKAWQPLNLKFDAVYSGFLGSAEQIDTVKKVSDIYKTYNNIFVIDPVMADYGKLYSIFDTDFLKKMCELVPYADVLIPNMTEAMLIAGIEYREGPYDEKFIEYLLSILKKMGAKSIVLTGVYFEPEKLGVAVYSKEGKISYYFEEKINGSYHGTGDVFGSVLIGALMQGKTLEDAAKTAVDFVVASIKATPIENDSKYGVNFENVLEYNGDYFNK